MFKVPEEFRVTKSRHPMFNSTKADGNNGHFAIKKAGTAPILRDKYGRPKKPGKAQDKKSVLLYCIASDGMGWEHVSIQVLSEQRTPTWKEMCDIKAMFWGPEDTVIQYHPAEKDYVNNHSTVLHLWRPVEKDIPKPPPEMIGLKGLGTLG